jgi:murein L,D-transpeptidase YafK
MLALTMTMRQRWVVGLGAVMVAGALGWAHWPREPLAAGVRADRIVVEKAAHRLTLLRQGAPLRVYRIALGRQPQGAKRREGDKRTPEGIYRIDGRRPDSAFHRALHVSYPSRADVEQARRQGVAPGGAIMVHGVPRGAAWLGRLQGFADWTAGCMAMANPDVEEVYRVVPDGTAIEIRP